MTIVETYVHRGRHALRRWAVDPRIHASIRAVGYFLIGFALTPAALGHRFLPLALGWVCACGGWPAVLSAAGGMLGYRLFWDAGIQPIVWLAAGLMVAVILGDKRISRDTPLLLPAIAGLIVASSGVLFQTMGMEDTPIALYLIRVGLATGSAWLFAQVKKGRNPVLEWLVCGLGVLALVQIVPVK